MIQPRDNKAMKGVLFDLDGTLLDTYELIAQSFHHCMVEVLGEDRSMDLFDARLGEPLVVQLSEYTSDAAQLEALLASYRAHNAQAQYRYLKGFDGMPEALQQLAKHGWKMGVVTSKLHKPAQENLKIAGIETLFDCLVGADDTSFPKPHPDSLQQGARLLGLDPTQCFYVGDSPFDIQAGNAAGCTTIAVHWGQHPIERLRDFDPALECETPADLVRVVASVG